MITQRLRPRRWPFVLLAILAVVGVIFSYSGVLMAGMFTVSNPEQVEHWRRVAYAYVVALGFAMLLLVFSGVALWRRQKDGPRD
jgi:cytochrome c biogenesis protein CcdA